MRNALYQNLSKPRRKDDGDAIGDVNAYRLSRYEHHRRRFHDTAANYQPVCYFGNSDQPTVAAQKIRLQDAHLVGQTGCTLGGSDRLGRTDGDSSCTD